MGLLAAARRVMPFAALAVAFVVAAVNFQDTRDRHALGLDFKLAFAHRLIHGQTLYPTSGPDAGGYPYPPLWAMLVTPFTAIPGDVALWTGAATCLAAIVGALWIIGLRDPYCYAVAIVSEPVLWTAQLGNATAIILLLSALTYRRGAIPAGIAVAIKPYAWPVLLWSFTQRGTRNVVAGAAVAAAAILLPWAALGFDGIARYPSVVQKISDATHGYTLALPATIAIPLTVSALASMWLRRTDPVGSFSFATAAMLAATPVLWGYYLVAILLPIALRSPRLGPLWVAPLAMWWLNGNWKLAVAFGTIAWCGIVQDRKIAAVEKGFHYL